MKRRKVKIASIVTALVAFAGINLIFGRRHGNGRSHFGPWRHHFCGNYNRNAINTAIPDYQESNSSKY